MQDNGFSLDAVTAAIAGDKEGFTNAFTQAISAKVADALEAKKAEIASNLLVPDQEEVTTHEVHGSETEVDGGFDGTVDAAAAAVAE